MFRDRSKRMNALADLLLLWGILKIGAHIQLMAVSVMRPLTTREQAIALWPPGDSLSSWLERVLFAPMERWDVAYYMRIASQGYRSTDGTMSFHPLYPISATPFVWLGIEPLAALILVSTAATLLLVWVFHRLATVDLRPDDASFATLALIVSPGAMVLALPYPEALFLLLAVSTFLWARSGRWLLAGVASALATLTRQQGLFLVLPMVWLVWQDIRDRGMIRGSLSVGAMQMVPRLVCLCASPLAYVGWTLYRAVVFADLHIRTDTFRNFVYSLLVSPSAVSVAPVHEFLWPWDALNRAVRILLVSPDVDIVVNVVGGLGHLLVLALVWRHLSPSYRIYTVAITCVSFAYHTGSVHPYMGLLRHLFLGFPVFIGLAAQVRGRWQRIAVVGCALVAQCFLLVLYGYQAWVL